jgi:short subunit dehydrogenase-like uncharacterized protein
MIIPACGFDSVPADMLYWFAMQHLKTDFDNAHVTVLFENFFFEVFTDR